jgi:tetraacyldisaccharide 4'-kinase
LNPRAPILTCRTIPEAWVNQATGEEFAIENLPESPVAAFCGLANPASFWETLDDIGCKTVLRREFADHHRYARDEIDILERAARDAGAKALVATEKDLANLPAPPSLPLYWLRIGLAVENGEELFRLIRPLTSGRAERLR